MNYHVYHSQLCLHTHDDIHTWRTAILLVSKPAVIVGITTAHSLALIVMFGDWFRVYDPTCIHFWTRHCAVDDNYDNVFPMCVEHAAF